VGRPRTYDPAFDVTVSKLRRGEPIGVENPISCLTKPLKYVGAPQFPGAPDADEGPPGRDKLLEKLIEVHREPREDLFPGLK
jgi:hypothetical protein